MYSFVHHCLSLFSKFAAPLPSVTMIPDTTRSLSEFAMSADRGFLPPKSPLTVLPDPYYASWEAIISELSTSLEEGRFREQIDALPVLSTSKLQSAQEWQRAYAILAFFTHSYIWGGETPSEKLPEAISAPFLEISSHLGLPATATYAALNLWNWKPVDENKSVCSPENIDILHTFTGTRDEEWFLLISVAMEARCAVIIPVMLKAISASKESNSDVVKESLHAFAKCAIDLGDILERMYEECDPYVFYYQIRPFLAGSMNQELAGLPRGVFYDEGNGNGEWRKYSGGSNAQSSLIQFMDAVLSVEHEATGALKERKGKEGFLMGMRRYMPGPHREFLQEVDKTANIRDFVLENAADTELSEAFNYAVEMLSGFRDRHIRLVTRYIINPSRNPRPTETSHKSGVNIATYSDKISAKIDDKGPGLYGTGGTQLIPFLKQTRLETANTGIFPDGA